MADMICSPPCKLNIPFVQFKNFNWIRRLRAISWSPELELLPSPCSPILSPSLNIACLSFRIIRHFRLNIMRPSNLELQESRVVAKKPHDAAAVLFGLKFADNIHCKFKSSLASKARLQSSKRTDAKQNLRHNGYSRSLKVTCFGFSGKATRD